MARYYGFLAILRAYSELIAIGPRIDANLQYQPR